MESLRSKLAPTVTGRKRYFCCHSATLTGRFAPNSIAAVIECVENRVPRLEIDVRYMADDSLLIFHDSKLEPSTNGVGRVDGLSKRDVLAVRYREDPDSGLCFLEDVVDALTGSSTLLQVDLKLMRPISSGQARRLERTLAPLAGQVIVGSQAHWNLRSLRGLPVALDPALQWRYAPDDPPALPRSKGVHGFWDDAPIATNQRFTPVDYLEQRIIDTLGLLPNATEWMVDIATIERMGDLGLPLGERLRREGCSLAAWTLRRSQPDIPGAIERLFGLGVETIITDVPVVASESAPPVPS